MEIDIKSSEMNLNKDIKIFIIKKFKKIIKQKQ
jgi:hypothetical protein